MLVTEAIYFVRLTISFFQNWKSNNTSFEMVIARTCHAAAKKGVEAFDRLCKVGRPTNDQRMLIKLIRRGPHDFYIASPNAGKIGFHVSRTN